MPSRPPRRRGSLSKSLATCWRFLTPQNGLPEFRRRAAVGFAERGAEVAVAGKAKVEAEGCEVVILSEKIQRARQAQSQLIAIQGHAFDLLENLREINRGAADFRGNLG